MPYDKNGKKKKEKRPEDMSFTEQLSSAFASAAEKGYLGSRRQATEKAKKKRRGY